MASHVGSLSGRLKKEKMPVVFMSFGCIDVGILENSPVLLLQKALGVPPRIINALLATSNSCDNYGVDLLMTI